METENNILAIWKDVLSFYPTNRKINHQKYAIKYFEAMKLRKEKNIGATKISRIIDIPSGTINYWLMKREMPVAVKGIKELEEMNLLPLEISNLNSFKHFMRALGLRCSDGCIYEQKRNNSFTFYVCFSEKINALKFIEDCNKIWNIKLNVHYSSRAYYVYLPASVGRLMLAIGSPCGDKTTQLFRFPKWIFELNETLKWEFIDGLFSGDGDTPRLKKSKNSCESLRISLSSEKSIVKRFCEGFMMDLYRLFISLNIKVTKPKIGWNNSRISKEGKITYPVNIRILTRKNNMIKFLNGVKYRYRERADVDYILERLK